MNSDRRMPRAGSRITIGANDIRRLWTNGVEYEYVELSIGDSVLRYGVPSPLLRSRIETLFSREPMTPPWLASFDRDDIFVDVGANCGLYSIYAAVTTGARVWCFEPESQNYAALNRNIFLNGLNEQVTAYSVALTDAAEVSLLYLCTFAVGFGHHDFGTNSWKTDLHRGPVTYRKDRRVRQGAIGMTLDSLVESGAVPVPSHIKIDVDGFEWKVLEGARRTLVRPQVKSVLVEIDFSVPNNLHMIDMMREQGWEYSEDQIRVFGGGVLAADEVRASMERGVGEQNFIFFRDSNRYRRLFAEVLASVS